ncbi:hypothetical protein OIU77_005419 [Salix suchowensis]|uniref:Pentatricopeptide repeat-containing protein n=1 Tax=Salix suchowensis TaxID=1278906 RepID=A0ABQ9APE5_9ROSI|nr:hypothetical protein OIU77_005419 [Salix suchowensis]
MKMLSPPTSDFQNLITLLCWVAEFPALCKCTAMSNCTGSDIGTKRRRCEGVSASRKQLVFAYYVTGHGFGHATRVVEVVRNLILAGHDVHVVTGAPDFVFTSEIQSPRLFIRKVLLDCGAVQADALTVDRLASLEKYSETAVKPRESILATKIEWLNSIKADLVVSDVVPVACRAAADAGIRSVCVTNFRVNVLNVINNHHSLGGTQFGDLLNACKVFDEISHPCIVEYNAMLDAYAKNGDVGSACFLLKSMPKRDVVSWTSVISGFAKNGFFGEAIRLFREMMLRDDAKCGFVKPNEATYVSVLSSCANLDERGVLCMGKQIHGYIGRNEICVTVFIGTALIDFYGKVGCLSNAIKVYNQMAVKKICTWNAIISSLANNGREEQALDTFKRMKEEGLCPNEVTFVAVLTACARAKLVEIGLELFQSMAGEFGLVPLLFQNELLFWEMKWEAGYLNCSHIITVNMWLYLAFMPGWIDGVLLLI